MKKRIEIVHFLIAYIFLSNAAFGEVESLIPREILFGNPVKSQPQISPDGNRIAYLAPSEAGVLNVWTQTLGKNNEKMVTQSKNRDILYYKWAYDGKHLLYFQDSDGDENFHLFSVNTETKIVRGLTPFPGAKSQNLILDDKFPNQLLIGLNLRDPRVFDMYRLDLQNGCLTLDTENPGDVLSWVTDWNFVIRGATALNPEDVSTVLRVRDAADQPWRDLIVWDFEDSHMLGQVNGGSMAAGFSRDGKSIYVTSSRHSNTLRLENVDVATGKVLEVIAEDDRSDVWMIEDIDGVLKSAVKMNRAHDVEAVVFHYEKPEYRILDARFREDFKTLSKLQEGIPLIRNEDVSETKWIVSFLQDAQPNSYYLYDRKSGKLDFLFTDYPELKKYRLAGMKPVRIPSRDGLELVGYLALPPGLEPRNLPLVLVPHGGPWLRDHWGFIPEVQWLANRGYAVLKVNFRGSIGFGKKFLNAATGEWAGKMQNDLTDGVRWAISQGIANPERVAVFGGSYGGYATLVGITMTPDLYSCAVDLVGPSNVKTLLQSIPDYWKPVKNRWLRRIGNAEKDEELNRRISPVFHVDKIEAPLLIAHGANDPRVKLSESETIVQEMRKRNLPVTFVVYSDEGHGFVRAENNLDFYGRAEEFLGKCLGGRVEPWKEYKGSTAELR